MARLTREESQALTRARLLQSAAELFRREGYEATSIERIADAAGFTKGAFYSNFDSKEDIFLIVLERQGNEGLDRLIEAIDAAPGEEEVVEALASWADECSRNGIWSMPMLEHVRLAGPDAPSLVQARAILQRLRQRVGERVRTRLPRLDANAETIGALLHEIAFAPALTFMPTPRAGELMRLALSGKVDSSCQQAV